MSLQDYFEAAINLETGEKLVIPCVDVKEQNSVRTRLFYLRKQVNADYLSIYRSNIDDRPVVVVEKKRFLDGFIIKNDGSIVNVRLNPEDAAGNVKLSRMVSLAILDGLTLVEFLSDLGGAIDEELVKVEWTKQTELRKEEKHGQD